MALDAPTIASLPSDGAGLRPSAVANDDTQQNGLSYEGNDRQRKGKDCWQEAIHGGGSGGGDETAMVECLELIEQPVPSRTMMCRAFDSQISNRGTDSVMDTYLDNPFQHYEHVGVNEEDRYSIGSDISDSDSDETNADHEYVPGEEEDEEDDNDGDDSTDSDDEEWATKDAECDDQTPVLAYPLFFTHKAAILGGHVIV
uniref:Uncharacterized protein n=1 Tax=Leersia perrieri TaxID=77586 RepID=A0A0D9X5K3_9ORYZ